jgi:thiol-disulfide isomerase/thioredoxin
VALAESGLKAMALSKLKLGSLVLLAAGLVAVWAGVVGHRLPAAAREEPKIAASEGPADTPPATVWPEGATVKGRIVDHRGAPVAKAEVLLLGEERVIVEAERRTWFLVNGGKDRPAPPSTKTDANGEFTIERKKGPADRLLVIADDPLMWVVPRKSLVQDGDVAIKLPSPVSILARCNLPGKAPRQPVLIQLQQLDGGDWDADSLRFHFSSSEVKNPGETLFEHLPPGRYVVERYQQTGTGRKVGMFNCDRQLVSVGPGRPASVRFERGAGRPVTGRVRGLEGADLRYAYVSIHYPGPEEHLGKDGRRGRMITGFDSIPITSDGRFKTDPMPPGRYQLSVFAVRTSTPEWSVEEPDFAGDLAFTVPPGGDVPALEVRAKPRTRQARVPDTDYRVRVVDEAGEPVPAFQALLYTAGQGSSGWTDGGGGVAGLGQESMYRDADALYVLVRADGYAPAVARFEGAGRDALRRDEVTITLRRGRKVELRFRLPEGLAWPAGGLPEVYFGECEESVRMMRRPVNHRIPSDYNVFKLHPSGPGRFEVRLAADTPPVHVAVHLPGFLQHFEAGPFTLADVKDGALTVDVPRPASLDVRFDPGVGDPAGLPFNGVSFEVLRQVRGDEHLYVVTDSAASVRRELRLTDLAPGTYRIGVSTQSKTESKQPPGTTINPGLFHDTHRLVLEAGKSGRVDFRYAPFDPLEFRGPRTAVLHVRNPDGTPASDRELTVQYQFGHYGYLTVFAGRVPRSGDVTLRDLTDQATDYCPRQYAYGVNVGGRRVGTFGFTADGPTQEFEFRLPPGAGDPAPDVELRRVATGESVRLGSLRGKVVCLEFWATWCGPCQPAVAKLNAMSDGLNAAWKDKPAIVPVSVDAAPEMVRSHSLSRGWTRLDHFWAGPGEGVGFDGPAARAFVVNGVPEVILIGRDGRIVWRGHPLDTSGGRDLRSRIEAELKK